MTGAQAIVLRLTYICEIYRHFRILLPQANYQQAFLLPLKDPSEYPNEDQYASGVPYEHRR